MGYMNTAINAAMTGVYLQVILAKVLRSTPKHLLVDPGYYGLNVVARQVCVGGGGGGGRALSGNTAV